MRKIRILMAAMVVAAGLVAAAPPTSAGTISVGPVFIQCQQRPSSCFGIGIVGTLVAQTFLSPHGDDAVVCIGRHPLGCDIADAVLVVEPNLIFGGGLVLGNGAILEIAPRFVRVLLLSHSVQVDLVANNGAEGVIILTPGVHKCLFINGLTITAPLC